MGAVMGTVLVALALPRTGGTVADMNTDNTAVTVTELAPACALPVR